MFKPRKWQAKYLDAWRGRQGGQPFMLTAIPGSGKTMAALETVRMWMAAGADRRVIIVVPSDNLRTQWQQEALKFGLELQSKEFGTNFKHGFQGGVVTYQWLAGVGSLVAAKLCSVSPVMVVFDEIHHCGEDSSFGAGIRAGLGLAKEVLCMSGTPWKTDGEPIPFVRYDDNGFVVSDYRYDYPDALTDNVVRYMMFDCAKGAVTNDVTSERFEMTQEASDEDAAAHLRILLDPHGEYVRKQIEEAHERLMEVRKESVRDAAALALCVDHQHAKEIARVIRSVTGVAPSVIVSDENMNTDTVESFRRSDREWLVSVRKVSEGVDIQRLQVLCYLTNVTTDLFFRQAIGRVSRVRGLDDHTGYVYMPADPRLKACAENIANAQVVAALEEEDRRRRCEVCGAKPCRCPCEVCGVTPCRCPRDPREFESWTTEHNGTDAVMLGSTNVEIEKARIADGLASEIGIPVHKAYSALTWLEGKIGTRGTPEPERPREHTTVGLEEQMNTWRQECAKAVGVLGHLTGVHYKEIHRRFPRQESMTLEQLKEKYRTLWDEIKRARAAGK